MGTQKRRHWGKGCLCPSKYNCSTYLTYKILVQDLRFLANFYISFRKTTSHVFSCFESCLSSFNSLPIFFPLCHTSSQSILHGDPNHQYASTASNTTIP